MLNRAILRAQTRMISDGSSLRQRDRIHACLTGVPIAKGVYFHRIPGSEAAGLIAVRGTVTRLGPVRMVDDRKTFQCGKCRTTIEMGPDDHQFGMIGKPTVCMAMVDEQRCGSTKFEWNAFAASSKEDYQEIRIQELSAWLEIGAVPRSLVVVLRHHLVDLCKAGDEVLVTGWMVSRWKAVKSGMRCENEFCLVANNATIGNRNTHEKVDMRNFSSGFWVANGNSPLTGRDLLISSFCPQIYGLHLVKLAVLLTIIGGTADEEGRRKYRREGHILLVGDPGTAKSQFLVTAAKITPRSVMTTGSGSTNAGLTVAAVKDSGEWQLEAGALVLADCGICCIDEFNALRGADRTSIHEAMEQQTLSVAKAGLVCKLQTRCSIIAACNSKGRFEEGELISSNVALASPLLSRFDLIIVMADKKSEEWDKSLSTSILEAASKTNRKPGKQNVIDFDTLRSYISYVRGEKNPVMTNGARIVLGKYYQLQRRADLRDVARTTIRLLESLIRLAQSHAKLMCQDSVEVRDAVWSIVLMETSLCTQSTLGMRPDVYAMPAESPNAQYEQYEGTILKKLEINLRVLDETQIDFDDEMEDILCSWQPSQADQ